MARASAAAADAMSLVAPPSKHENEYETSGSSSSTKASDVSSLHTVNVFVSSSISVAVPQQSPSSHGFSSRPSLEQSSPYSSYAWAAAKRVAIVKNFILLFKNLINYKFFK